MSFHNIFGHINHGLCRVSGKGLGHGVEAGRAEERSGQSKRLSKLAGPADSEGHAHFGMQAGQSE